MMLTSIALPHTSSPPTHADFAANAGFVRADRVKAILAAIPGGKKGFPLIERNVLVQLEVLLAARNAATALREAATRRDDTDALPRLLEEENQAASALQEAVHAVLHARQELSSRAGKLAYALLHT
jgi:hypothetical protein